MSYEAWKRYLENPSVVERYEFDRILTVDRADPAKVFEPLPHGKALADGVRRLQSQTAFDGLYYRPTPSRFLDSERLFALAQKQQNQFAKILEKNGESGFSDQISQLPIRSTDSWQKFEDVLAEHEYIAEGVERADVYLIQAYNAVDQRFSGAHEVILHLTMEPSVADHIVAKAIGYAIDYEPGFEIYLGGGRVVFLDECVWAYIPRLER